MMGFIFKAFPHCQDFRELNSSAIGWIQHKFLSRSSTANIVEWQLPPLSYVKLNTDGAFRSIYGVAVGGVVIRDLHGEFIAGFSSFYMIVNSSLEAKANALRDGIILCTQKGYRNIIIEMDLMLLVQFF
ncbi:hypothetical protein ACH5RR_029331 [Cinchona calisaya]|uniref:RNase H type-1 domain-containing protein n=1 Tax=Cinchona calisaya TaxID=153742 RepID=A0ABD2YRB9_9GENT